MEVLGVILLIATTAVAREYTDEELSNFPRLFHLDDYERCLAQKHGLYCLGTFDLTPHVQTNPTYELLKVYSDESHRNFNRTRIHRGYCISSRCPNEVSGNVLQRFERCANEALRNSTLRASVNALQYCHTHADRHSERSTTFEQQVFLQCLCAIVVINIIGTIYDMYTKDGPNKNKFITAFSIPANWRSLMDVHESTDPQRSSLRPLNGIRGMSMLFTTLLHAHIFHYAVYTVNPEYLERLTERADGVFLFDGTSLMQILLTMSCFFNTYNLLMFSKIQPLSISKLPLHILKRFIRMAPVSLLVVGFAASWWMDIRDGPLVSVTIGAESTACQNKFWSHVFFVNNIVSPSEYCVAPTWFLPVDMHMYILACTLTLVMWRHRAAALKLYSVLFFAACIFVAFIAYVKEYKSIIYITTPEELKIAFRNTPSFTEFYISSWGALPSCFLGLLLAHIQIELDERQIKLSKYKWFVYLHYCAFPLMILWPFIGFYAHRHRNQHFYPLYIMFNRPVHCLAACITLLGLAHVDSPLRRFYNWSGWTRLSRLSLTVMSLHWIVNMAIATRPVAFSTSGLDIIVDWAATCVITYSLAVPITLLVEIPTQKFFRPLLF